MSMNPPERRASLQEGTSTSNRAALAFYSHQRLMLKAISELQRTPGGVFANSEIRRLASVLQDVIIDIENELKQAGRLVEDITNDEFLDTDLGKIAMQDPRTGALVRKMNDAVAKAVTHLREIRYTSAIQPSHIAFVDVPDLQTILTSLGADIDKGRDTLQTFAQTVTNSRQEWPEIKLASAKEMAGVSADVAADPVTALAREWNQKHFEMDPYFLADLDEERIELYKATIMKAALSMFPPSTGEKGTRVIAEYEKDLISYFDKLRCPVDVDKLYDYDLPDDALLRWRETEKAFAQFEGLRSKPLRLCVFGLFNEGKSSFINALVGKRVLFSDDGLATAWPIVVCHDAKEKSPVLHVPSGSLKPFLDLLRQHKFSQILDPNHPSYEDLGFRHQQTWLTDQAGSHPLLTKFEAEGFDFPPVTRNTANKPNAVMDMVNLINQLVRICWQLCPSGQELPITSNMWPQIHVEFAFFAGQDTQIELLDCPGSGEATDSDVQQDTEMPDLIQETALKSCLDGSFCIMKAASGTTRPWKQLIASARGWTEKKPLAVYITHKDDLGKKQKEQTALEQVNRGVYGRSMAQDLTRVKSCAPGVFVNAHLVLKKLGIKEASTVDATKAFLPDEYWPPSSPVFENFIDDNTEPSLLKILWGVTCVEEAKVGYARKGYTLLKQDLSDVWGKFNFFSVAEHFKSRAICDGLDRRQFRQLCFVRTALQDLLAAQKDLIDWTLRRDRNFSKQQSYYDKFEHDAQIQWVTWKVHYWKRTRSIAATTLETRLEDTKADAKKAVVAAIADAKEQMMMEGETDVTELGGAITIESRSDQAKFLALVYSKLLPRATKIQKDHVDGIRENAKIEWTALMNSLATEIFKFEPDFTPYPRDEIVSVLRNAGDEMGITVYNHLIGIAEKSMEAARLRDTLDSTDTQELEATEDMQAPIELDRIDLLAISEKMQLMTDENLPFRIACASAQRRVDGATHLDRVTRSVAHGLDEFGFMFRPSIPVSVVVPGTVAEWVWENAALPGDKATARVEDLEKNFATLFVDPWVASLERDSEKTLDGTICKVRDIARVAVKGFLKKRSAFLDKSKDYSPPAVPDVFLQRLFTWHACSSVVFGMVDDLCQKWINRVDKRLLPEVSSSSKNQIQQTSVNPKTAPMRTETKPKTDFDIVLESFARTSINDDSSVWTSVRKPVSAPI